MDKQIERNPFCLIVYSCLHLPSIRDSSYANRGAVLATIQEVSLKHNLKKLGCVPILCITYFFRKAVLYKRNYYQYQSKGNPLCTGITETR